MSGDLNSLQKQLELYTKGDYEALEQMMSTQASQTPLQTNAEKEEEVSIISYADAPPDSDDETDEMLARQEVYPPLTPEKTYQIRESAKKWTKIQNTLDKIKDIKKELDKERKGLESELLEAIKTYGLKDIKKGKHQLVPKVHKGGKQAFSRKLISDKLTDFLTTADVVEEDHVREVVLQATEYLDNTREKKQDCVKLQHVIISK
jgi:hypothetical protein